MEESQGMQERVGYPHLLEAQVFSPGLLLHNQEFPSASDCPSIQSASSFLLPIAWETHKHMYMH